MRTGCALHEELSKDSAVQCVPLVLERSHYKKAKGWLQVLPQGLQAITQIEKCRHQSCDGSLEIKKLSLRGMLQTIQTAIGIENARAHPFMSAELVCPISSTQNVQQNVSVPLNYDNRYHSYLFQYILSILNI